MAATCTGSAVAATYTLIACGLIWHAVSWLCGKHRRRIGVAAPAGSAGASECHPLLLPLQGWDAQRAGFSLALNKFSTWLHEEYTSLMLVSAPAAGLQLQVQDWVVDVAGPQPVPFKGLQSMCTLVYASQCAWLVTILVLLHLAHSSRIKSIAT